METFPKLEDHRVLILGGIYEGEEGLCLGKASDGNHWAISPDSSNDIIELTFESEFALLLDLSTNASRN